jgi:hypothetical protein
MMGGYSAPPAVHSSLDRITETIIVTSQADVLRRNYGTQPGSRVGHVWTAPCGQALFGVVTIAVGCSHVSGLLVQPFFTTAGPDVVREVGPDQEHGLDTRDPKKVLPPRRPTDQHHAISTSATRDALRRVPLALALQSCAAGRGDHPIAKPLIRWPRTPRLDIGGRDGRPRRRRRGP